MKKIMFALATVVMAIGVQAATANWFVNAQSIYDGKGDAAARWTGGTAYIFDATLVTQAALFDAFAAGTAIDTVAGFIHTVEVTTAGNIRMQRFEYGNQSSKTETYKYDYFLALVDDDSIYLSATKAGVASSQTVTPMVLDFGSQAPETGASSKSLPTVGFVEVGQWARTAIPEPTSGLLMLVGMAGLALRRSLRQQRI